MPDQGTVLGKVNAKGWTDCTDGNTYCLGDRYQWDCNYGTDLDESIRGNGCCNQYISTEACDYANGGSNNRTRNTHMLPKRRVAKSRPTKAVHGI